jgi:hypothetical protein
MHKIIFLPKYLFFVSSVKQNQKTMGIALYDEERAIVSEMCNSIKIISNI